MMTTVRCLCLGLGFSTLAAANVERVTIDFEHVRRQAARLAAAPYAPERSNLPRWLAELSYDDYRLIVFQREKALWRADELPFQVQFFHPGGLFRETVVVREFSATHAQVVPFASEFFDYSGLRQRGRLPSGLRYAGFRVTHPLNRPDHFDELVSFLGASYFRALGAGQVYGISARGLAIDSGLPTPEEFPRFTEFWLGKPAPGAGSLTIYALLDGPRVAGAFEFVVHPGSTTTMEVRAELTFRASVALPGFAPLTSMFWFGKNTDRPPGEPRPQVHDSDGLAVETADHTWWWRPLQNPTTPLATGLATTNPRRFGLVQRDRHFANYQDLEAEYHRRPSAWVEPVGEWGAGSVHLVELPTRDEYQDNIVAFWVPAETPRPGQPIELRYRLHWAGTEAPLDEAVPGRVAATRTGTVHGRPLARLFWIDFAGERLARAAPDALSAEVKLGPQANVLHKVTMKNPHDDSWRVALQVEANEPGRAIELRVQLRDGYTPVTETWIYHWVP
jgi:glucans biosynthesis protein